MKNLNYLILLFICICLNGCDNKEKQELQFTNEVTPEKVRAILEKYNLDEGSFSVSNISDDNKKGLSNKKTSVDFTEMKSLEEFEAMVAAFTKYQNSKEGIMAKKFNEFSVKSRTEKWSDKEIDDFLKEFDSKFGTNHFEMFRGELPSGSYRFSTIGKSKKEIDTIDNATKAIIDSLKMSNKKID
ncbi:metallophosphoesterase family protein [Lutibacter citreus]|uniref:hypothetical protein n=1 Tax=Lutibacter citreus TaxID=2138210 RepID=UPI000DBE56FD|nr:hypothetical protein [Lutibacter citreus]